MEDIDKQVISQKISEFMSVLPDDLVHFLARNEQMRYDPAGTAIGRVRLKGLADIAPSLITTFPGRQGLIDDPYQLLNGLYQIDVFDLIAESEEYESNGLLCWITAVQRFGCIDPEHGKILVFPDATWTSIVADPVRYLDQQWAAERDCSEILLPWLAFPFAIEEQGLVLRPYPKVCPKHNRSVTSGIKARPEMVDVLRRRSVDGWLRQYLERFPCSGLPVNDQEMLFCQDCSSAENEWLQTLKTALVELEATPRTSDGWIKCPNCGIRFSTRNPWSFHNNIHLRCGQKIRLREPEDRPLDYRANDKFTAETDSVVHPPKSVVPTLDRTLCHKCGRDILKRTADKHGGLCKRCALFK